MHFKDAYAHRMNELRLTKGLTKTEFMKQTVDAINNLAAERAEHFDNIIMTIEGLIAAADVLGCSTDYLLGRTDTPK